MHYLNMKMKEKSGEIIGLQLGSSLKLYCMYKGGVLVWTPSQVIWHRWGRPVQLYHYQHVRRG